MKKYSNPIILMSLLLLISGCVSQRSAVLTAPSRQKVPGVYHRVKSKETLWKISKAYNVALDEIVKVNRIPDVGKIEKGQLIFIPRAGEVLDTKKVVINFSKTGSFVWPVTGKVASYYGQKISGRLNKGIDIQTNSNGDVYASRAGKISFCGNLKGYGKTIIIEHNNNFTTVYSNILDPLVEVDSSVSQRAVIAKTASAEKGSQSFLHFEIRKGHLPQNPLFYLP
ncbi:MAG: LysM peptidoglycan-binding domain-containing M23 family metallopeptidase [Candidatus Omnitrophota bacterium]